MSDSEVETAGTDRPCWRIDLSWFPEHRRSFATLVEEYLCKECAKETASAEAERSDAALLERIGSCCSKQPDFISPQQPLLESVFRTLLVTGNRSLPLDMLAQLLHERRGGARIPEATLLRLLQTDSYYGLRPAPC